MSFIVIDLGTTNVKVAVYDINLNCLNIKSTKVEYQRQDEFVEFDAEAYYQIIARTIKECSKGFLSNQETHEIILTGQAESLVIIGQDGKPLRNAISWLDERSKEECKQLSRVFDRETCYQVTGQVSIIPTWPITKIVWIKKKEPEVFSKAYKFLLLKDYIQYRLTGKLVGEYSIYNFSLYFDIRKKCYWEEILNYANVQIEQLPDLVEPCTNIGQITTDAARKLHLPETTTVNVGTLDHFAGMIGTGNIKEGIISETTGTVLSIATLVSAGSANESVGIPCHYGPFKDSYVLLSICESGGISLEWYKNNFLVDLTFDDLSQHIQARQRPGEVIFLPYLIGINAPDYEENATGVFYGLKIKHDKYDLALAVMEGVAYLMANNIKLYRKMGVKAEKIISTGGGSRSRIWSQIKADILDCEIVIPDDKEAACLGAAMIGAVDMGFYKSFEEVVEKKVFFTQSIHSQQPEQYARSYEIYNKLFSCLNDQLW